MDQGIIRSVKAKYFPLTVLKLIPVFRKKSIVTTHLHNSKFSLREVCKTAEGALSDENYPFARVEDVEEDSFKTL